MKIDQSEVSFFSSHKQYHEIEEQEHLNTWNREEDAPQRLQRRDTLKLSQEFAGLHRDDALKGSSDALFDVPLDSKMMSIVRALEALMGKKINISSYRQADVSESGLHGDAQNNPPSERLGWGIEYSYSKTEKRGEKLDFSSSGSVSTKEGRRIDFKLAFSMQRSSVSEESILFKAGDALIDPLVLNFGSNTLSMSNVKHNFDLDLDGKNDEFSFVGEGSGFLALDKNGDKTINDGSELFGPTLGNGFEELSKYDSDHNGWIDENDAVFDKLLIWTKDEDANERLFTLKEKGIGALYLQSSSTPFELQNRQKDSVAQMRESSIYLRENGGAGTLQEIDLKI
ncbi:hypothetical protein KJ877_02275 [bacterium]|nr:hypothetical protein [bacterium]MBU1990685.1 hypothetical protein [bacterium]